MGSLLRICMTFLVIFGFLQGSTNSLGNETFLQETRQQGTGCNNFYQTFSNVGEWSDLISDKYPGSYSNNLECRYTFVAPRNTLLTLECPTFNVEPSPGTSCDYDMFFWSLTGDASFRDKQFACGQGYLSRKTTLTNRLTIGFHSDDSNPSSNTYRYQCRIEVVPTVCSCGVSGANTRIVGGSEAKPAEFPFAVALYTQNIGLFCGATLIHNEWLLTAAHCTKEIIRSGERIYADIGDHNLTGVNDANNQVILVDRIIQNSQYNSVNQDSDTSLLHLSQPVAYARNIQPACLPFKFTGNSFDGAVAVAVGWGTTSFGGSQSDVLRKVEVDVIGTQRCRTKYQGRVEITDRMICAARAGKDTCQSDSGGGLYYLDPSTGQYYNIGVISFGIGCAEPNNPGVYAQAINFLGWIEQNTGVNYCKA